MRLQVRGAGDRPPDTDPRVLLVEDEAHTADVVGRRLRREGFRVQVTGTPGQAGAWIDELWPDLMVLDAWPAPNECKILLQRLRSWSQLPVIMISPLRDSAERIWGLALGADDFMGGPLDADELALRIRSLLRRAGWSATHGREVVAAGPLVLDDQMRRVRVRGAWVTLTAVEFALLAFLARSPHHAFRREELLEQVWGYTVGDGSTVTVHVRRLREKIEVDPAHPMLITTVWGVGYCFKP
ncbi:MAG: DNA-binding response regulator [Actinobacteria bacterium]|nr:MAG: DNA-binding response regulator [Actinomycetota bacterium]